MSDTFVGGPPESPECSFEVVLGVRSHKQVDVLQDDKNDNSLYRNVQHVDEDFHCRRIAVRHLRYITGECAGCVDSY